MASKYNRLRAQAVATAAGVADISFGRPPAGWTWHVQRIAVQSDSLLVPVCTVYEGAIDQANVIDFTTTGNGDVADQSSPILVTEELLLRWTGATPGANVYARVQIIESSYGGR